MHVAVGEVTPFSLFHHAYAPIDVGRHTVAEVVADAAGNGGVGIESLVADKHAMAERPPGQTLGHRMVAVADDGAALVGDVRLAVYHAVARGGGRRGGGDGGDGGGRGKRVAGVEIAQIVARGKRETLVHCIIQARVALGDDAYLMARMMEIA